LPNNCRQSRDDFDGWYQRQAREIVATEAQRAGVPVGPTIGRYVDHPKTVKTSIKRLKEMKAQQEAGPDSISKKEQLTFARDRKA
jgi:small subunit ribosomal protein S2